MKSILEKGLPALSTDDIQQIGLDYFRNYESTSDTKSTLEVAQKMMKCKEPGNVLLRWLKLINYYHSVDPTTELAKIIKNTLEASFKGKIESSSDDFGAQVIRQIIFESGVRSFYLFHVGSEYLNLHGEAEPGYFGFKFGGHTNQAAAKTLIDSSSKYLGKQSWIKLYHIYKTLPKESGKLASNIRNIFRAHFHEESFENTIKQLGLADKTKEDLEKELEKDIDLSEESLELLQSSEEELLRLQAEKLFCKNEASFNAVEEFSVFWVNRSPYFRIVVTGGATICMPVAAGIFLTANVYALITLGVALGGGLFVLELIGHTGIKAGIFSKAARETLIQNHVAMGLATSKVLHIAGELSELTEEQKRQILDMARENGRLAEQIKVLHRVSTAFIKTQGEQEALTKTLEELTSDTSETSVKLLKAESDLNAENKRLKKTVESLESEVEHLREHDKALLKHMEELRDVMSEVKGTKSDLERITSVYDSMLKAANVEISEMPVKETEYHKKSKELYLGEPKVVTLAPVFA